MHEEEERLILQKSPLQKKLAEISWEISYILSLLNSIMLKVLNHFEKKLIYCLSYLTVAKVGLKHISNDVERCLSLVRCRLLVHCLHSVLEAFFLFVFSCVCGRSVWRKGCEDCFLI